MKMKKNFTRRAEIRSEQQTMLDLAELEKRKLTEPEREQFNALEEEKRKLEMDYLRSRLPKEESNVEQVDIRAIFAQNASRVVNDGAQVNVDLRAAPIDSGDVSDTIPVLYRDILDALEPALILNQLGIKMQTNVQGEPLWPTVAGVEATIEGENAEVADSTLEFGKIKASPKRLAVSIPVSRRAFNQSNLNLYGIVTRQIGLAVARTLNKWVVSPKAVGGTQGGVFTKTAVDVEFAAARPTFAEVVALETNVLDKNVVSESNGAYVVSTSMAGILKTTPIDSGSGKMLMQKGEVNGYPVIVTNLMPAGAVGFGYFSYACLSEFSGTELIIDPYSSAKKNIVNFVLNGDFDFTKLRPEAFSIGATAAIGNTLFT